MLLPEQEHLQQVIATLESQRPALGDRVVETALAPLRAQLAALQNRSRREQRKQITVLFADISGFTALSETLDAEEVQNLVNQFWQVLDQVILRYGGHIDKHMGDAVMALFGIDEAQEDDVERAIQAALAMQQAVADFPHSAGLQLRIGLHTGLVLLGTVGTTLEYTAIGDAVNLASRLEQAAPVGGILISQDTYREVRGVFEVKVLAQLRVKGKVDLIQVYQVLAEKPRAFRLETRGIEGLEISLIGRSHELGQLQACFEEVCTQAQLHTVTLLGEAGLGKSRLLYEFDHWLELLPRTVVYFKGRAWQQKGKSPYALLRDVISRRFNICDSDSTSAVEEKLTEGLREFGYVNAVEHVPLMGQLLGFDFTHNPDVYRLRQDPRQLQACAYRYFCQFFMVITQKAPAVLFLEDLHWADEASLDFLRHLCHTNPNAPLLIVSLARPEFSQRYPGWFDNQTVITLKPLIEPDMRQLVRHILRQVNYLPLVLEDLIIQSAEGNPFYVEELIKMLIEEDVIRSSEEIWEIEMTSLHHLHIPSTLNALLQARLDSLPFQARELLQKAAVVGRVFWDQAVSHLNSHIVADRLWLHLREREFIFIRDQSSFLEAEEYIFKHALLRDVTYESVLKRRRKIYHQQVAEWLCTVSRERTAEYAGLIGDHYSLAGQETTAAIWYFKAAQSAQITYVNDVAIDYYQRAIKALPESDKVVALLKLGKVYELIGCRPEAHDHYQQALTLAECLGDQQHMAQGQRALGELLLFQGTYDQALAYLQQAQVGFTALDDPLGLGQVSGDIGVVYYYQGNYEQAICYHQQHLLLAEEAVDEREISIALGRLGLVYDEQGDLEKALDFYQQKLSIAQRIRDQRGVNVALGNIGTVYYDQGKYDQALLCYQEKLVICTQIGDRKGMSVALCNMGMIYEDEGEYSPALACYAQDLSIGLQLTDRQGITITLNSIAAVYLAMNDLTKSEWIINLGIKLAKQTNISFRLASHLNILTQVKLRQSAYHLAQAALAEITADLLPSSRKEDLFRAELLGLDLDLALKLIDAKTACHCLVTLLEKSTELQEQAELYYIIWHLTPGALSTKQKAATMYRDLYIQTPKLLYWQRYAELTGEHLPQVSLPALPNLVTENTWDLELLLGQVATLIKD